MTEWVDFAVYAVLVATIWFVLPAWGSRFTPIYVSDRNPEWFHAHPDVAAQLAGSRWYLRASFAWGAVCIAVLFVFQAGVWPDALMPANTARWEAMKDLHSILLLPWLVPFIGSGILFNRWLQKTVPLAERRQATLERRSIDGYVPGAVRMATYAVVGVVLLAWLVVAVQGRYSTGAFWGRFALMAILTPIFAFFVRLAVNRPPHSMDRIFGPGFRAREVRIGFAMHVIPPVAGMIRLYEEVAGVTLVDLNRAMHLAVALLVVFWGLAFATIRSPRDGKDERSRYSPWPAVVMLLVATLSAAGPAAGQSVPSTPTCAGSSQLCVLSLRSGLLTESAHISGLAHDDVLHGVE